MSQNQGKLLYKYFSHCFREETEKLKEGEIDKIKNYSAMCWSKSPLSTEQLNKLTEMKVGQQDIDL